MVILVALFVEQENYNEVLNLIKTKFKVQNNKIFVLNQEEEDSELIFTFNIEISDEYKENLNLGDFGKLIRVHRKKETNTLYTINALNAILKNNVNWDNYKYSFLTVSSGVLKSIKTHLKEVIDLK